MQTFCNLCESFVQTVCKDRLAIPFFLGMYMDRTLLRNVHTWTEHYKGQAVRKTMLTLQVYTIQLHKTCSVHIMYKCT